MLTAIDMVILFGVLYVIHNSFRQVNMLGFVATFAIAVSINYYMVNYLHISFVIGLLLVVTLTPIIQFLLAKLVKGTVLEPKPKSKTGRIEQMVQEPTPNAPRQTEEPDIDAVNYAQQQGLI